MYLLSSDGKCGNTDFQTVDLRKGLAAADEGGSGGENVVDQQDVFPAEVVGVAEAESILDVLLAVGGGLAALFMGITVAHQGAGVDGTAHYLRYTAAEKFALVISSLQAASPVQRDRY